MKICVRQILEGKGNGQGKRERERERARERERVEATAKKAEQIANSQSKQYERSVAEALLLILGQQFSVPHQSIRSLPTGAAATHTPQHYIFTLDLRNRKCGMIIILSEPKKINGPAKVSREVTAFREVQ